MEEVTRWANTAIRAYHQEMEDAALAALGHGLLLHELQIRQCGALGCRELVDLRSGEVLYRQPDFMPRLERAGDSYTLVYR